MKTNQRGWESLLNGRSARIVVTMGMPAFIYRWYFGAHGLKSLERSILRFVGIKPIKRGIAGLLLGSETVKVLTHSTLPVLVYRGT